MAWPCFSHQPSHPRPSTCRASSRQNGHDRLWASCSPSCPKAVPLLNPPPISASPVRPATLSSGSLCGEGFSNSSRVGCSLRDAVPFVQGFSAPTTELPRGGLSMCARRQGANPRAWAVPRGGASIQTGRAGNRGS